MRIPVIADEAGRPGYVSERRVITVDSANQIARWSQRYRPIARREHDEDGYHSKSYHCQGVVRFSLDTSVFAIAGLDPSSTYRQKSVVSHPTCIQLEVDFDGEGLLTFEEELPPDYEVICRFRDLQPSSSLYLDRNSSSIRVIVDGMVPDSVKRAPLELLIYGGD